MKVFIPSRPAGRLGRLQRIYRHLSGIKIVVRSMQNHSRFHVTCGCKFMIDNDKRSNNEKWHRCTGGKSCLCNSNVFSFHEFVMFSDIWQAQFLFVSPAA
jgi:hypothetical protein